MLNLTNVDQQKDTVFPVEHVGIKVMSMGFVLGKEKAASSAVVNGAALSRCCFPTQIDWAGSLDYLARRHASWNG